MGIINSLLTWWHGGTLNTMITKWFGEEAATWDM